MELIERISPEVLRPKRMEYFGEDPIAAEEQVEIKVNGDSLFDEEVPTGKIWNIRINMEITETDA